MGYQYNLNNIYDGVDEYLIYEIFKKFKQLFVILKDERELVRVSENLKIIDSDIKILEFPAWDTFPFDKISPNKTLLGKRIFTLNKLKNNIKNIIVLSTISSVIQKLPPVSFFENSSLNLTVNQEINFSNIIDYLNNNSYLKTSTVREIGEFAYRGSIIDIFPVGHDNPIRIDLFGNILESIKVFDPIDQKSVSKIDSIEINTGNEFILNSDMLTHSWVRDFSRDSKTEDWDLINSEGKTIEVKSTKSEGEFRRDSVRANTDKQKESMILKLLMSGDGFQKLKFISFEDGKWINKTNSVLKGL